MCIFFGGKQRKICFFVLTGNIMLHQMAVCTKVLYCQQPHWRRYKMSSCGIERSAHTLQSIERNYSQYGPIIQPRCNLFSKALTEHTALLDL